MSATTFQGIRLAFLCVKVKDHLGRLYLMKNLCHPNLGRKKAQIWNFSRNWLISVLRIPKVIEQLFSYNFMSEKILHLFRLRRK